MTDQVKGLTFQELKDLKLYITPQAFFECINFLKIICAKLGIEYESLFLKEDKLNLALILSKVPDALGHLAIIFSEDYQEVNKNKTENEPREQGKIFKEYIRVLSLASGISKEQLSITSPKILVELFLIVILDPYNSFDDSFFLTKLFRLINMMTA